MTQNQTSPVTADWIAADWGTSHLRVWAMQGSTVLAEARSTEGMGRLGAADAFEPALRALVSGWLGAKPMQVVACGMVGAKQGWIEAGYQSVPCPPLGASPIAAPVRGSDLSVHIIPGLMQNSPPDVMRGEETQIAGFLALNPGWDGVMCLPGTHSKWAQISAGEVVSFQTFMTGEMFSLLSRQSVLRHSVGSEGWDADAFAAAVSDGLSNPERIAARLFSLRASDLLQGVDNATSRARLSGLLIGAELAAARPYWLGQQIAVLGSTQVSNPYVAALATVGAPATQADGARMVLAGLTAAYRNLKGSS